MGGAPETEETTCSTPDHAILRITLNIDMGPSAVIWASWACLASVGTSTVATSSATTAEVRPALSPPAAPAPVVPPAPPMVMPAPSPESTPVASLPVADTSSSAYEITVVGTSLAKTGGSAQILDSKKLEQLNYDDPHAVLAAVPGVYSRGEDGVGLRPNIGLRGVNPDRSKKVTLLEDGLLFGPAPYSAPAAYYFPLITRMNQVRVIKGPAAVSYGPQTIAGAIDLVTRPAPATPQAAADLAGGAYGYKKAHAYAGMGGDDYGVLLEAVHLEDQGFKRLFDERDTGSQRNELMLKGRYQLQALGLSHQLGVKLGYADEVSNETYLGLTDADFAIDPNQRYAASQQDRMQWHRTSVVLSDTIDFDEDWSLTTSLYRHDLDRTWRKVNGFRGDSLYGALTRPEDGRNAIYVAILQGREMTADSQQALYVGPNQRGFVSQGFDTRLAGRLQTGPLAHRIEGGVRVHYDRIRRRHSQDAYWVQGSVLIPEAAPTDLFEDNEAFTVAGAAFATDAVTWEDLTLTPGVRLEVLRNVARDFRAGTEQANRAFAVLPGLSAYYDLYAGLGLLAGVHRGFSPPVPSDSPNAEAELSVNYEVGARYTRGRSRLELIGFYNDYSNLTDNCTFSSGCNGGNADTQFDAGAARIYGLEASGDYRPQLGAFTLPLSFAYTLTQAHFLDDFESDDPIFGDVRAGDEIPYVPNHQLNASVGLDHPWFALTGAVSYLAAMREEAGSEPLSEVVATGALLTFDASLEVRPTDFLDVYLNVRNLFDEQVVVSHRPFGARPNAPRWVQVGLRVASF